MEGPYGHFNWIEVYINPEQKRELEEAIKPWTNADGTPNVKRMIQDIRKEIRTKYKETMKWQSEAIKHSLPCD